MPDKSSLYDRLNAKVVKNQPQVKTTSSQTANQARGFDIGIYLNSVGLGLKDFFTVKIPFFFKNPAIVLKKFPSWFSLLPTDEKIAYSVLVLGNVLVITGIALLFIL